MLVNRERGERIFGRFYAQNLARLVREVAGMVVKAARRSRGRLVPVLMTPRAAGLDGVQRAKYVILYIIYWLFPDCVVLVNHTRVFLSRACLRAYGVE